MAQFTADRKKLATFLKTFGKDIQDILLKVSGDAALLEASVGTITHFLRARLPVTDIEAGDITINDLPKVLKFIEGNKSEEKKKLVSKCRAIYEGALGTDYDKWPETFKDLPEAIGMPVDGNYEKYIKQVKDSVQQTE